MQQYAWCMYSISTLSILYDSQELAYFLKLASKLKVNILGLACDFCLQSDMGMFQ